MFILLPGSGSVKSSLTTTHRAGHDPISTHKFSGRSRIRDVLEHLLRLDDSDDHPSRQLSYLITSTFEDLRADLEKLVLERFPYYQILFVLDVVAVAVAAAAGLWGSGKVRVVSLEGSRGFFDTAVVHGERLAAVKVENPHCMPSQSV